MKEPNTRIGTGGRVAGLLIALLIVLPVASAQKRKLDSKAKNEMKKLMAAYVKGDEDARAEVLPQLMVHGRAGIDFLQTLKKQREYPGHIALVTHRAKTMLGLDLLSKSPSKIPAYTPGYFAFGEMVLFKSGDQFGGLRIPETRRITQGWIEVEWWSQRGAAKKLDQPGGKSGKIERKGLEAARPMRPNTGYTEYDFELEIDGTRLELRFVGPAYFRVKLDGNTGFAFTGKTKAKGWRAADKKIGYMSKFPSTYARMPELMQQYIFRTVQGCEALPLEDTEKDDFAQYEAVQVILRTTRPAGEPVILVKFLEPGIITFGPREAAYITNFAAELAGDLDYEFLIMSGNSAGLEGNVFWQNGDWKAPGSKLIKSLRVNFPEEY